MTRPESSLRPGDKIEVTPQRVSEKGVPLTSVVCRIFDDKGIEHLHIGLVTNPTEWAEKIRYNVDNPTIIEGEV